MEKQLEIFGKILHDSWANFQESLPALVLAIVVGSIGFFLIRRFSKLAYSSIEKKAKDPLVSDFLVNIVTFILSVFLIIICLSILGWGSITNKILAGAGIGTVIIGFALKDIGENFLAGILLAFNRPFRVGDLIEINNIQGRVIRMSLRETTIKSLDGRDIFIPNGMIVKNPLQNYTIDNFLRNEFIIGLDYKDDVDAIINLIEKQLATFEHVLKDPKPNVFIEELGSSSVNVKVLYWIETSQVEIFGQKLKGEIIGKIYKMILANGYNLPSNLLQVKLDDYTKLQEKSKE